MLFSDFRAKTVPTTDRNLPLYMHGKMGLVECGWSWVHAQNVTFSCVEVLDFGFFDVIVVSKRDFLQSGVRAGDEMLVGF